MTLRLAPGLKIPLDFVTQTMGILAVRGAGKSNAAAVLAEELDQNGLPFVAVDPVGAWWGLRSSSDGKGAGLSIPIFGGRRGDVPLERGAGATIADLVVEHRLSAVLDVSELSETDKIRFLIDFGERLYRRNEQPLHLILEEADDYAPQRPMREQARLLRVWENIVRRGRARGLGITMVTQRSAALNKNVLTQIETLLVLRTTSPQDRKAIASWIEYHDASRDVLESLAKLKPGEAWVWSPSFLGVMTRVQIRRRKTFDSGATPAMARRAKRAATLADIDLDAVKTKLSDAIERQRAEDPRELKRQLAEARRELAKRQAPAAAPAPKVERLEVPVVKAAESRRLALAAQRVRKDVDRLEQTASVLKARAEALEAAMRAVSAPPPMRRAEPRPAAVAPAPSRVPSPRAAPAGPPPTVSGGVRAILTAIAQHQEGCTREQLTVLTGYKRSSRDTYLQRLTAAGLVERAGDRIVATSAGVEALGSDFEPLPTGDRLREHWLEQLGGGERSILATVCERYPQAVSRDEISEATQYRRSSRDTYLQRLAARRLIETDGRGAVRASEALFE